VGQVGGAEKEEKYAEWKEEEVIDMNVISAALSASMDNDLSVQ
jgi:hypothetical protein